MCVCVCVQGGPEVDCMRGSSYVSHTKDLGSEVTDETQ